MEELLVASDLLVSALRQYTDACFAATKAYSWSNYLDDNSHSLLDLIAREMQAIPNYESELQKTRIALTRCRNFGRTVSPINTIPPEILARIFGMARSPMLCSADVPYEYKIEGQLQNPRVIFPEALTHVCTLWRDVAVGTPELWAHIDLTTSSESLFKNLLARGQLFSQRAGSRPLDIHFAVASDTPVGVGSLKPHMRQFNHAVLGRTRRLTLETWAGTDGFGRLLESIAAASNPDILEELVIKDNTKTDATFSHAYSRPASSSTRIIGPNSFLNSQFRDISRLTLEGAYLPWSSPAYVGLTDLRIFAGRTSLLRDQLPIAYLQLARILSSCPGLRTFHFNLPIEDFEAHSLIHPVVLNDLEEVNIRRMSAGAIDDQPGLLLSLLAPGSKPLSLSLSIAISGSYASQSKDIFSSAAQRFFERSNTTELYVTLIEHPSGGRKSLSFSRMLAEMTTSLVKLRILGLDGFVDSVEDGGLFTPFHPPRVHIDTLVLHRTSSSLASLRILVGSCAVKKLVVRNAFIEAGNEEGVYGSLAEVVPFVKYSTDSPRQACCPIDEWASHGHLD